MQNHNRDMLNYENISTNSITSCSTSSITSPINNINNLLLAEKSLNQNQLDNFRAMMLNALQNSPPGLNSPANSGGYYGGPSSVGTSSSIASPGSAFAFLRQNEVGTSNVGSPCDGQQQFERRTSAASTDLFGNALTNPSLLAAAITNSSNINLLALYSPSQTACPAPNPLSAFEQISKLITASGNSPPGLNNSGFTGGLEQYLMLQKFQQQLNPPSMSIPTILNSQLPQMDSFKQQTSFESSSQHPPTVDFDATTKCLPSPLSPYSPLKINLSTHKTNGSIENDIPKQTPTIRKIRRRRPKSPRLSKNGQTVNHKNSKSTKTSYVNNNETVVDSTANAIDDPQISATNVQEGNVSKQQITPENSQINSPSWIVSAGGKLSQASETTTSNNNPAGTITNKQPSPLTGLAGMQFSMDTQNSGETNDNDDEMCQNRKNSNDEDSMSRFNSGRINFDDSLEIMDSNGKIRCDAASFKRRQKMCLVCGDQATGYNFNVITCESCKAFFRRNALRPKDFKCPYSEECEINTVGMKKEWILNEDQLRKRKNSRLNTLKSSHNQSPQPMPSQLSPTYTNISSNYGNKNSNVCSPESDILSPQPMLKGVFMSQAQQLNTFNGSVTSPVIVSSEINLSPQNTSNGTLSLLDLGEYGGTKYSESGNIPTGNSIVFGSRTSSHSSSMELPIMSPMGIQPNGTKLPSPTASNVPPMIAEVPSPLNSINNPPMLAQLDTNLMRNIAQQIQNTSTDMSMSAHESLQKRIGENTNIVGNVAANPIPTSFMDSLLYQQNNQGQLIQPSTQLNVQDYQQLLRLNHAMDFGKLFGNQNNALSTLGKSGFLPNYSQQSLVLAQTSPREIEHNTSTLQSVTKMDVQPTDIVTPTTTKPTLQTNSSMDQVVDVVTTMFSPVSVCPPATVLSSAKSFDMPQSVSPDPSTIPKVSREHLEFMRQQIRNMDVAIQDELDKSPESCYDYQPTGDFVEVIIYLNYNNFFQKMLAEYDAKTHYKLEPSELAEIEVVQTVYSTMDEPLDIQSTMRSAKYLVKDNHDPSDIMNIMNIAMRRFVKAAKSLPSFKEISDDGKFFLLKNSMIDLLTIRGATRLDIQNLCFKSSVIGGRNISCSMFDKLNDPYQKERFIRFCQTLHPSIRTNPMAIQLLNVVVLYSRHENMLKEDDRLKAAHLYDKYMNLLRRYYLYFSLNFILRYLEMAYEDEAALLFATVPKVLKELADIANRASTLFLGLVNQRDTEALPTEFFKIDGTSNQKSKYVNNNNSKPEPIAPTLNSMAPLQISSLKIDSPK